ncbi:hypothetical protein, partial [Pediococcus parvulus]
TRRDTTQRYFYDPNQQLTTRVNRGRFAPAIEHEKDVTAFWQHNFDKEGKEFRAEFTASTQSENESNYYRNVYSLPTNTVIPDNNFVIQHENNQQVTADWVNPVSSNVS